MYSIFKPFNSTDLSLKNRIVMAPMTRSRAIDNIPNALMEQYYGQRTDAGLIITEGTAPSPESLGYPRIPGVFSKEQIAGWKNITTKVHQKGSKIFLQLMHTGRIGHQDNLPPDEKLVGPSDIPAAGEIFTDTKGFQAHSKPKALTLREIKGVIADFVQAAKNAIEAGFDGVEIHGANGYLIEQFFNPHVNNRTDDYGGSIKNRANLAIEIAEHIAAEIGRERTGIRLSPFSNLGDLPDYDEKETHQTYTHLAEEFNRIGLTYIHIGLNPNIPDKTLKSVRRQFGGTLIYCNGLDKDSAQKAVDSGQTNLVAFARNFLANPDFVSRIKNKEALNGVDYSTLYTPGSKGYVDYPAMELATVEKD